MRGRPGGGEGERGRLGEGGGFGMGSPGWGQRVQWWGWVIMVTSLPRMWS